MGSGKVVARTVPGGTIKWDRDATANDSDKSFTVPVGKIWSLKYVLAQLSCTATVGNRIMLLYITNGTDRIVVSPRSGNIAASQIGMLLLEPNMTYGTSTAALQNLQDGGAPNVAAYAPLGELYLPAGYVITVKDNAAVDAAADDMTVILHYEEFDV